MGFDVIKKLDTPFISSLLNNAISRYSHCGNAIGADHLHVKPLIAAVVANRTNTTFITQNVNWVDVSASSTHTLSKQK